MPLEIEQLEKEGITILVLKGPLVLGPEDLVLRQRLSSLVESGTNNVILNLLEVPEIDTAGFGSLVSSADKFRKAGGRFVLLDATPKHAKLSEVLKMDITFAIYADEQDAINSFFADRAVAHFDILEFVEEQEHSGSQPAEKKGHPQ
jgi:anti-sigma B factor antagonist